MLTAAAEPAARDPAAREVSCCLFFTFDFDSAALDVVMSIGVGRPQNEVLDALAERVGTRVRREGGIVSEMGLRSGELATAAGVKHFPALASRHT